VTRQAGAANENRERISSTWSHVAKLPQLSGNSVSLCNNTHFLSLFGKVLLRNRGLFMRGLSAGLIAVSVVAASIASAADMPTKAPAYAPPVAVPYNWTGSYIGGHFGYGWGSDPIDLRPDAINAPLFATAALPFSMADNPRGGLGGVQYGTNWQFNRIVLGWESDFSITDIKASQTVITNLGAVVSSTAEQKLDWLSTTRGRIGYTITDNLLLYGTGGLASGRARASTSIAQAGCPVGNCLSGGDSQTLWGWEAGAGVEYAMGHWLLRAEYLHYDLGDLNYTVYDPRTPFAAVAASSKVSGDIVRGGISYKFDWTFWDLIFGQRR
jgi:outer membrane immunogenic protein